MRMMIRTASAPTFFNSDGMSRVDNWIMVATMIVCSHIPAARPVAVLLSREGLPEIEEAGTPPEVQTARTAAAE